jgi:hypothetical protein
MAPPQEGQAGPEVSNERMQGPGVSPRGVTMPNVPKVDGELLPNPELQAASGGNVK